MWFIRNYALVKTFFHSLPLFNAQLIKFVQKYVVIFMNPEPNDMSENCHSLFRKHSLNVNKPGLMRQSPKHN